MDIHPHGPKKVLAKFQVTVGEHEPPWEALRERLQERLEMARGVLDEQGYEDVAALVPIEEVLIWMDEIGATDG